jgi:hypothetical protein
VDDTRGDLIRRNGDEHEEKTRAQRRAQKSFVSSRGLGTRSGKRLRPTPSSSPVAG